MEAPPPTGSIAEATAGPDTPAVDPHLKHVPADEQQRDRIREAAKQVCGVLCRCSPPDITTLRKLGRHVLTQAGAPEDYLGFAFVAINNAFWRDQFAAVPFPNRLLLLPHCLRDSKKCPGTYDETGLTCAGCGACAIAGILEEARALGYRVLVAEGTPAVLKMLMAGTCDAILGVACLDSLEKAFRHLRQIGIPHMAVPLLRDGCTDTEAELPAVEALLHLNSASPAQNARSYLPLMRLANGIVGEPTLGRLLEVAIEPRDPEHPDPTACIARDWLCQGGKRFRPFMALATYAALTDGADVLEPGADLSQRFPDCVLRIALALEALHKASLAHDDIADDDAFRYGMETLHRRYGVPLALNVGDYLIGLGYRLVLAANDDIGPGPVNGVLAALAHAHLALCHGQGDEIVLTERPQAEINPLEILAIYARKTSAAFAVALQAGAIAAGDIDRHADLFRPFARALGVAYQVRNDLDDWRVDTHEKRVAGQDGIARRPTILRAFALQALGHEPELAILNRAAGEGDGVEVVNALRHFYEEAGAFAKAEDLLCRYRGRAHDLAANASPPRLAQYLTFLVDLLLSP